MTTSFSLGEDFENIVRGYYVAEKYQFIEARANERSGYDFMVLSPDNERIVVEVKVYRTRIVQRTDIIRAVRALESARQRAEASQAFLYISSAIAIPIHDTGRTQVVDINNLANEVSKYPRLLAELQLLVQQIAPMPMTPEEKLSFAIYGDAYLPMSEPVEPEEVTINGASLCGAIHSVKPGKKGARAFEDRSFDALQYIFEGHFSNWQKQKVTDGGVSRFDLVARISSSHSLWQSIVGYFRSWYVVFEFKNYTAKITQGQIYTTEKYLFAGAMRTVAIVISRKGPDKNALAATRGAARESGKLIIHLTIEDLCKMLELKDFGGDPNAIIFDLVDEMLMKLER